MEKDYQGILDYYLDFETRNLTEIFLKSYWLSDTEYNDYWHLIQNKIFCLDSKDLPDLMFNMSYEIIARRGGILFSQEEFFSLQNCMKVAGDQYFVVIENKFKRDIEGDFHHLRFKFPADISWEKLNNGDEYFPDISHEALYIMNKHFFVFGDSGKWGKYAAMDYLNTPLDIIGFQPALAPVFRKQFEQPKEEMEEIREWLPEAYKKLIED